MSIFSKIKLRRPKKNKFDLSHERKMSADMGLLVPIMVQDIVPGDSFRVQSEILMRVAPLLAPMMHRVNVFTHYFFVPNRLVWNEWEDFITGGREGTSTPVMPHFVVSETALSNMGKGTLADYLGFPSPSTFDPVSDPINISLLPFRAYQTIFNEYYRDQNLSAPVAFGKGSGVLAPGTELTELLNIRSRAWEKDYFTSALPWAQRGGSVSMPFEAEVNYYPYNEGSKLRDALGNPASGVTGLKGFNGTPPPAAGTLVDGSNNVLNVDNIESISAGNVTINELRRAVRLQEWLEKNARGGARYIEQILSHFGVVSSDARLQRPEYLGGGKNPLVISEVLSTFQQEAEGLPQGNMSGHGISVGKTNGFSRTFEEHGYVIGIMSVLPRTAYQNGVPRHFTNMDKLDYYWPEFANIGEQEVKVRELYYDPYAPAGQAEETFGYQSRYAEHKFQWSTVHGDFRDNLAFWHMGRIFEGKPVLNEEFVKSDPTTRIYAVEGGVQHLWIQIYNRVSALRPMPYYGTPTL